MHHHQSINHNQRMVSELRANYFCHTDKVCCHQNQLTADKNGRYGQNGRIRANHRASMGVSQYDVIKSVSRTESTDQIIARLVGRSPLEYVTSVIKPESRVNRYIKISRVKASERLQTEWSESELSKPAQRGGIPTRSFLRLAINGCGGPANLAARRQLQCRRRARYVASTLLSVQDSSPR